MIKTLLWKIELVAMTELVSGVNASMRVHRHGSV